MAGKIYQAREPFLASVGGEQIVVQPRTTVREGHPLLEGREHLFEPFAVDYEYEPPPGDEPPKTPRTRTLKPAE